MEAAGARCLGRFCHIPNTFYLILHDGIIQDTNLIAKKWSLTALCLCGTPHPFDEINHRNILKEADDVAGCRYDWKMERGKNGINL